MPDKAVEVSLRQAIEEKVSYDKIRTFRGGESEGILMMRAETLCRRRFLSSRIEIGGICAVLSSPAEKPQHATADIHSISGDSVILCKQPGEESAITITEQESVSAIKKEG